MIALLAITLQMPFTATLTTFTGGAAINQTRRQPSAKAIQATIHSALITMQHLDQCSKLIALTLMQHSVAA